MADVTNIQPVPPEPGKPEQRAVPADKFKEQMKKIGESPEKQKKQRERREEKAQKTSAELRTGATPAEKQAEGVKKASQYPKIEKVGESQKRQPKQQKLPEEVEAEEIEGVPAVSARERIEALDLTKIETTHLEKKEPSYVSLPTEEIEAEKPTPLPLPPKEEKITPLKKKEVTPPPATSAPAPSTSIGPLFIPPAPQAAPAYTLLSGDALVLYEKMVSQILIMRASGMTETIFHLDAPEYASSPFAGAQIIIREYSTAPLSFNVELIGSPQNALAFEQNIASLRAAFESEKRNFSIHRIESRVRTEKPPFRRVERKGEEGI